MKTFEKYLEEDVWEPEGVLDDDMPDAFDDFLANLDVEEVIGLAEDWGKEIINKRVQDIEVIIAKQLPYDGECSEDLRKLYEDKK